MKLIEQLTKIAAGHSSYDSGWGLYAEAPVTLESECRVGQTQFEQGGILDGKEFFADGIQIIEAMCSYAGDYPFDFSKMGIGSIEIAEETFGALTQS